MVFESTSQEKLVEKVKKHWMYLFRPLTLYIVAWSLSVFFIMSAKTLAPKLTDWSMIFLGLALLFLVAAHHWFFFYLLSREVSLIVITDKQMLNFEYLPLIKKDLSVAVIQNIDEIEEKQEGLIQNIFHYGEVIIKTSAGPLPVTLEYIPHPTTFIRKIRSLQ